MPGFEQTHALLQLQREPNHFGGLAVRQPAREVLPAQHHRPSKRLKVPGLGDHRDQYRTDVRRLSRGSYLFDERRP